MMKKTAHCAPVPG